MAYEVLARKWRPQVFEDVVGQDHITGTLVNALKTDRLAHAYLFSGARGVGKTSVARILAKALNCAHGEPGVPCNQCTSCLEITGGSSVDVQEIDGASNRGIDEIRELRENIRYMPSSSRYRIYIIDEVHMLTKEAFNALLKTLEEPPPHVKFFFATTEPHKVPVTILSRCQRFDFKRIPPALIVDQLGRIAQAEGITVSREGLALIAREARGGMRDAESLLDQVLSFTGTEAADRQITDILGIVDRDLIFEASNAVIEGDAETCIRLVERIYNRGCDIKEFYQALMEQFRNLLVSLIVADGDLLDMTESDREALRTQARRAGREKLQQVLTVLIRREEDLRYTSSPRLILETLLIKLCHMDEILGFEELMEKLGALEARLAGEPGPAYSPAMEPSAASIREPAAAPDQRPDVPEAEPPPPPSPGGWDAFMAFLGDRNRAMANVLRQWRFVGLEGETLEIERGANPFSATYLDEQERLTRLTDLAREFFGRALKIRISGDRNPPAKKPVKEEEEPDGAGTEPSAGGAVPRPVQDVLRIFQGELREEAPSASGDAEGQDSH
ncbi:MAG: DNA polymerase III subunit gamma/tau [Deltaproteobacteria bacterium]|nr:DNA polymerase III subunit gamma/tau [Deltaproteobacteria bacterium]